MLDLDETLIHCQEQGKGDVQIPIKLQNGTNLLVFHIIFVG